MNKTYWWRYWVVLTSVVLIELSYFFGHKVLFGLPYELYFYCDYIECLGLSGIVGKPLFLLSLSLLAVSPFLFFIRDDVFKKWLRFAGVWFGIAAIFVALAPEYSGSWGPDFNPTKESVSIWMASLFVVISLTKITWDSRKKS